MNPRTREHYKDNKVKGDVLCSERKRHRMTQREASNLFEVTERTYCGWENGYKDLTEWQLIGLIEYMRRKVK